MALRTLRPSRSRQPTGGETKAWIPLIERLVLALAAATGWSEASIHAMPRRRFLRYARTLPGERLQPFLQGMPKPR